MVVVKYIRKIKKKPDTNDKIAIIDRKSHISIIDLLLSQNFVLLTLKEMTITITIRIILMMIVIIIMMLMRMAPLIVVHLHFLYSIMKGIPFFLYTFNY